MYYNLLKTKNNQQRGMQLNRTLLIFLLLNSFYFASIQAQFVSKNMYQILTSEIKNPEILYLKTETEFITLKQTPGSRIRVAGRAKISVPNLLFLEKLIEFGRYELLLTPDGLSKIKIEDKPRNKIHVKGGDCQELVEYTMYLPYSIQKVILENSVTGQTQVIQTADLIN